METFVFVNTHEILLLLLHETLQWPPLYLLLLLLVWNYFWFEMEKERRKRNKTKRYVQGGLFFFFFENVRGLIVGLVVKLKWAFMHSFVVVIIVVAFTTTIQATKVSGINRIIISFFHDFFCFFFF